MIRRQDVGKVLSLLEGACTIMRRDCVLLWRFVRVIHLWFYLVVDPQSSRILAPSTRLVCSHHIPAFYVESRPKSTHSLWQTANFMPPVSESGPRQRRATEDEHQRIRELALRMAEKSRAEEMDPVGALLNPNSNTSRRLISRMIYAQARTLKPESLDALAQHLLDDPERNRYIVPAKLVGLNGTFLRNSASVEEFAPEAASSLHDLAVIFLALDHATQTKRIKAYRRYALEMLLECWPNATMWIAHFIGTARLSIGESDGGLTSVLSCVLLLTAIYTGADADPYKAEIVSLPSTADLMCLLLCLKGGSTGLYLTLQSPGETCKICLLFSIVRQSKYGWNAILNLLKCRRPAMREHIFTALISRIRELVLNASKSGFYDSVRSVEHLIAGALHLGADETLSGVLEAGSFITELSSALCDLAKKAEVHGVSKPKFWECLGACIAALVNAITLGRTPQRASNIGKLLRGRIIECAVLCFPHLMNASEDGLLGVLQRLLPCLYISKVEDVASKGVDRYSWALPLQQVQIRKLNIIALRQEYHECIELNKATFAKRRGKRPNICANLWHEEEGPNASSGSSLKTCAGCHGVIYCSVACQTKDWTEFHSKECPALAKNYVEETSGEVRTTARIMEDQLRFLDTYINSVCPAPSKVRAHCQKNDIDPCLHFESSTHSPSQPNGVLHQPGPFVSLIDYHANGKGLSFYPQFSFETRRSVIQAAPSARPWIPRMDKCARYMTDNPDTVILAEGIFKSSRHEGLMSVFAKMRYAPDLAEGDRYTVTNSWFWFIRGREPRHYDSRRKHLLLKQHGPDVRLCKDAIRSRICKRGEVLDYERFLLVWLVGPGGGVGWGDRSGTSRFRVLGVFTKIKLPPLFLLPWRLSAFPEAFNWRQRGARLTISPGTSIPAGTSAHRDRQLLKLLRSARTVEPGSLEAVGKYIVQEKNLAGISTILDALDSSHIPKKPTTLHELASAARLSTLAEDALDDLATISLALNQIRALKEPAPIIKKAFQAQRLLAELLVERWASVTKWISFFLKQSESSGNSVESELKLVYSCCRALTAPVSAHVKDDPFTEELVTHPSTVKLVLRLLCRQDVHRRGRYYDLLLSGTSCLITNLFALVHDSEEGCEAMETALKALSGHRRRAVVSALISRAQGLVLRGIEDGSDQKLLYAVDSLAYLLEESQDFLTRYSEAIFLASQTTQAEPTVHSKAEPGFWSRLGWCVLTLLQGGFVCFATHPAVCLPGLIEAGILSAGAACLCHSAGHIASEGKSIIVHALETVLPYMYLSGVFDAALKRGDLRFWETPPVELQASSTASVAALVQDFQLSISLTRRTVVDRQRRTINLCSNIWAQDWSELHFRECRGLFDFYEEHKAQGAWTPMKVRTDQVKFIDTYMNHVDLSPSEMQAQDLAELPPFVPGATTYPIHYQSGIPPQLGTSLAILDYFTAGLGKGVRFRPRVSLESHLETMWNGPSADLWLLRMRRYIQTMEDDPEHTVLVEASFQFNNVYMMLVLARMRYSPLALEGERYTCLNSFMRLMERYEVPTVVRRTGTGHSP
ncbi:hypothetical protein NMY22_g5286 [Coprinellus aureogranulatus]|nr:hypothetical protein NMY22_g5286 [Coprinellus aureogranulatus]